MYYRYDSDDEEFEDRETQELYQRIAEHKDNRAKNYRRRSIRTFFVVSAIIYLFAYFTEIIDSWLAALIWLACAPIFSFGFLFFASLTLDYITSRDYDDFEKLIQLNCKFREIELQKEIRMLRRTCSVKENMFADMIEENRNLRLQLEELKRSK